METPPPSTTTARCGLLAASRALLLRGLLGVLAGHVLKSVADVNEQARRLLLIGAVLLKEYDEPVGNWLSVKVLSTAGLWLVFLLLLYLRYGAHVPARRLALCSIGAFALLLVALVASHPFAIGGAK